MFGLAPNKPLEALRCAGPWAGGPIAAPGGVALREVVVVTTSDRLTAEQHTQLDAIELHLLEAEATLERLLAEIRAAWEKRGADHA
jgi:hypothetical protein